MAESITGAQAQLVITPANSAAAAVPDLFVGTTGWSLEWAGTYEAQNDVGEWRTRQQLMEQKVTFTANGREINGTKMTLAKVAQDAFIGGNGTAKWHVRIIGDGTDGKLDRTARWCTLDNAKVDNTGGNKGVTNSLSMTAEDIG